MYMKLANANSIRTKYLEVLKSALGAEDIGQIASNSFNFPVVAEDGEEGWVEIVVKIPKEDGDEGFGKREEYQLKCAEKAEKAKVNAEKRRRKLPRIRHYAKPRQKQKRGVNPLTLDARAAKNFFEKVLTTQMICDIL